MVREVGGLKEDFDASGVLFRLPMILLAIVNESRVASLNKQRCFRLGPRSSTMFLLQGPAEL